MNIAIVGAGAIGGAIGLHLHEAGHRVVLVARGPHLEAIVTQGLTLETPERTVTHAIPAVGSVAALPFRPDACFLATKTQDAAAALSGLDPTVPVFCAQNGVESERIALRRFQRVYGVMVWVQGSHLRPGVVSVYTTPPGVLDLGAVPGGVDPFAEAPLAEAVAAALRDAGFLSEARPDILWWKYGKLLRNLGNAVQAACGLEAEAGALVRAAEAEGQACLEAEGIGWAPLEALLQRASGLTVGRIEGAERSGGSTWQSLARESGSSEVDYLNGEIVLRGRLQGVPTPVNAALQAVVGEMALQRRAPGSVGVEEVWRRVAG